MHVILVLICSRRQDPSWYPYHADPFNYPPYRSVHPDRRVRLAHFGTNAADGGVQAGADNNTAGLNKRKENSVNFFFPIRPPPGLLTVLGPMEQYCDAYTWRGPAY